jgi:hypothetical protein
MFYCETPLNEVIAHLHALNIEIVEGPIERTGAMEKLYQFIS